MSRLDDWFWYTGRSEKGGYVAPTRSRFGWEERVTTGGSYSSVFWRPSVNKDKVQLITRAYNLAKEMILVMDTPTKVNIKILSDSPEVGYTDGKTVFVSTEVFDDKTLEEETEAVDIFTGLTVHEGCHLLFTRLSKFKSWIKSHVDEKTFDIQLRQYIFNALEDERVEQELVKVKPGLMAFLEKSKKYYFDKFTKDKSSSRDTSSWSELEKIVDILFQIIRYPKYLKESDLDVNTEFFNAVENIIIPLPKSTEDTLKAADSICDLLLVTVKEDYKKKFPETSESEVDKKIEKIYTGAFGEGIGGSGRLISLLNTITKEVMVGIDSDVSSMTWDEFRKKVKNFSVAKEISASSGLLGRVLEGTYNIGNNKSTIFVKSHPTWGTRSEKEKYLSIKQEIQHFIPSIRKILISNNKDFSGKLQGCKTGILDTTKLAEAYQGVEHVYFKNYQVKTKKTSVCLVIDESGSMCGPRERSARKAAILLNEAFKGLPGVDLYIYGHSADELTLTETTSTDIYVYREPGPGAKAKEFVLANSHARYENRDGSALREIAHRVRKFDKNEVIMFILSDGEPSANEYRGKEAREDTKKAVEEITNMGFIPIQISISAYHNPSSMFKNYLMITDLEELAPELGKVVKKAVLKSGISNTIVL